MLPCKAVSLWFILRYSGTVWQNLCSRFLLLALTEKRLIPLFCRSPGGWVRRKIYRGEASFHGTSIWFPYITTNKCHLLLLLQMLPTGCNWNKQYCCDQRNGRNTMRIKAKSSTKPSGGHLDSHIPAQIKDRSLPSPLTTGSQYLEKLSTAYRK